MAKFRGPRFLLWVLVTLLISFAYGNLETDSSTQTTTNIPSTATTITSSQDKQTKTGEPTTKEENAPVTSSTDKTETTLSPTHSIATTTEGDTLLITSTITPTSSTLMLNSTTAEPRTCSYRLGEEQYHLTVTINSSDPKIKYKFTFTNNSHIHNESILSTGSFKIPLKSFEPCKNYTVTVDPTCTPTINSDGFFDTNKYLNESYVTHNLTANKVCFYNKWKWENCSIVSSSNSCKIYKVDLCSTTLNLTLPPVRPLINYTNEFPTKLTWKNQPEECQGNFTYNCNGTVINDFEVLEPFYNYTCKGIYENKHGEITSEPINVTIDCERNHPSKTEITNDSIKVVWNENSRNCKIKFNATFICSKDNHNGKAIFTAAVTNEDSYVISHLDPYTEYKCKFTAMYNKKEFPLITESLQTKSSSPKLHKEIKTKFMSHNSFSATCTNKRWNGKDGYFIANLNPESIPKQNKSTCNFVFENLYYLTNYTITIYAINGNGNKSVIHGHYSTNYNDKAILGILGFLIIITTVALLFVLYKIYLLKREKSRRNEQEMDDLLPTSTLMPVEPISADSLLDVYKKKRADEGRLFMEEFQSIPRIFSNYSVREAKKGDNQSKNRYIDILPYDYNRVALSHGGTTDYINASFIEGYKESNKYIAAQGPKEETMADFWAMIWEQKTSIVVMVTRCEEGNKNKCAQYWPSLERETEIFDDLVVKIRGEENCPNYIIRHLTLMNRKEKSTEREVTHIQFTSWPDHGVPSDPGLLLKLRRRVNSFKNFFSGPIVIHCSAGVGRTGTYIGIDAMIESLEAEGRVDIYGYVVKLRRQRCLMVQVEAQYVLIHTALIEYSQFGETEISLSDYHSEVNTLRQIEGNEPSLIELEFQKLPKFKNYRASNTGRTDENKKKNRSSVIPYDFNRVAVKVEDEKSHESEDDDEEEYSSDEEDDALNKYINASYVDGYWNPSSFIVAQGPMEGTVADFLHMLYQKKVKSVFMLSDCTENDKEFCFQYWDDEKKTFEEMTVEVKETENFPTYVRRCLEIQHTKRKDSHTVQQYHFLKWTGLELPANPLDLIDMIKSIRQSIDCSQVANLPILAHCNDGSSRSGIFCGLWKLLDSADTEKLVDIFQVVKDLRKSRLGMINTLEQYEFLYTALEAAYPVQNGEVKKPSEAPADSVQVVDESTALITPSTDTAATESTQESTDPAPPEEGATEAKTESEKALSESTTNGPTTTVEV